MRFTPKPNKPGYVDECPECLYKTTAPKIPSHLEREVRMVEREMEKHLKNCKWSPERLALATTSVEPFLHKLADDAKRQ